MLQTFGFIFQHGTGGGDVFARFRLSLRVFVNLTDRRRDFTDPGDLFGNCGGYLINPSRDADDALGNVFERGPGAGDFLDAIQNGGVA
ncbi:hypothetical protein [Tateyamaria sp.]|uniref:hypothetical protein n=1 Tax=Tateyamaria sp. TaxID=1929288 RepID=UPI00329EF784